MIWPWHNLWRIESPIHICWWAKSVKVRHGSVRKTFQNHWEAYAKQIMPCLLTLRCNVDGKNPANQLRLVVYPIIFRVFYIQTIPSGCQRDFWTINQIGYANNLWKNCQVWQRGSKKKTWGGEAQDVCRKAVEKKMVESPEPWSMNDPICWANYNDQPAEVTLNAGLVRESPPKSL